MKRKVIIVIYVILILMAFKFIYNSVVNSILINKYNNNDFNEDYAKALTFLNFPQQYIANYNHANILYKIGKYEEAIEEYKKTLNWRIPENKECRVRINYALAVCQTVQVDENVIQSIEKAINTYESAIDILTEKGCANKDDDKGHNAEAEQLKKDIQKEIDRLKKIRDSNEKENSEKENNEEENKEEENKEEENKEEEYNEEKNEEENNEDTKPNGEEIENKIQDIKTDALQNKRDSENKYKKHNYDYNKTKKNW